MHTCLVRRAVLSSIRGYFGCRAVPRDAFPSHSHDWDASSIGAVLIRSLGSGNHAGTATMQPLQERNWMQTSRDLSAPSAYVAMLFEKS
jgi:hypothetical protein